MININPKIEEKIDALIGKMSIEQKAWQMGMIPWQEFCDENGDFSKEAAGRVLKGRAIGGVQDLRCEPEISIKFIKCVQDYLKKNTDPYIPALVVGETIHGYMTGKATIFPQSIGIGCSFNPELVYKIANASALEASSMGTSLALAPDIDIARDPRWGRVEETYGEDPYLVSEMGEAYVKGLQAGGTLKKGAMAATLKHFIAYCAPQGGINIAPVNTGEIMLRNLYLKPYISCINAGAMVVMPSYNAVDGIPVHANKKILTGILKEELGFNGFTIADYSAVEMLHSIHHIAGSKKEAGKKAVTAGLDFEAGRILCMGDYLTELVKEGSIEESILDNAVRRILRVKFNLGLFDYCRPDINKARKYIHCEKHIELAYEAAKQSIVLLENDGILPLDKGKIKKIAVIGPHGDSRLAIGDYSLPNDNIVTVMEGLKETAGSEIDIIYEKGCGFWEEDMTGFDKALKAAGEADVIIAAVGGLSVKNYGVGWGNQKSEEIATCGEGYDRCSLKLPGVQEELIREIKKEGKPVITLLETGRPVQMGKIKEYSNAVLSAWYPGEQGGRAIAEILFGIYNPTGKLCMSFPKSAGHIPSYYNHTKVEKGFYRIPGSVDKPGRDYVFSSPMAEYEFGYGLSYTAFEYSNLRLSKKRIKKDEQLSVFVSVKNTGSRKGVETVLLYVNDDVSSITTPVKELKAFKRVALLPGEEKEVMLRINAQELALVNEEFKTVVEPGTFKVYISDLKDEFLVE